MLSASLYSKGLLFKEKAQLYGMALLFLVLLYNSPAGLVLYWTANNAFSLLKNIYLKIPFSKKRIVLKAAFTVIFCAVIFYLLTMRHGGEAVRTLLAFLFAVVALVPWCIPAFKKIAVRLPWRAYNPKYDRTIFLLSMSAIWLLLGIAVPVSLVASSAQEFSYIDDYTSPLFFIGNTALQCAGFFIVWPLCLYFLFSDKVKKAFTLCAVLCFIAALCDVFLFPGTYGVIAIDLSFQRGVQHSVSETALNAAVIAALAAAGAALFFSRFHRVLPIVCGLSVAALAGLQIFHIQKIQSEYAALNAFYKKDNIVSDKTAVEPILSLSKTGKNVVLIMLDRAISALVPLVFEESPELYNEYSGFTYYPNTVSFNGYTAVGSPPLYGGYEYTPEEINKRDDIPLVKKHNEALTMLPLIFSENGFIVTVTDQPYANYNQKIDISIYEPYPAIQAYITDSVYTNLWLKEHNMKLASTSDLLKRNMFFYSVFRALPLLFRAPLYMKGNWRAPVNTDGLRRNLNGHSVLDYLPRLTRIEEKKNCFLILTNNTTHEGTSLQAPEYRPVLNVTNFGKSRFNGSPGYHTNAASLKRLADWFAFLKAEKMYDNTRIIIVSDHGPEGNFVNKIPLAIPVEQFNPLLMVKDFGAHGAMQSNGEFMSNADAPYLAMKGVISDEKMNNPFTGNPVSIERKKEPLYIAVSASIHVNKKSATRLMIDKKRDYYVHDNIFDAANWQKAE
jgi:hypothetical protein